MHEARKPQSYVQQGTDPKASQSLRIRYFAWVGLHPTARALRQIGWNGRKPPTWLGDGNIPSIWREKMEAQIAAGPYTPTE